MNIYILILWCYEGDSNLIGTYEGVFKYYMDAYKAIPIGATILQNKDFSKHGNRPNDWGCYGSKCRYEIREETIT